jgi:glycosyltransferase involved in cell wall biosynthesis
MQDISGDYLQIEESKPNIEVLLATYNGAAYLGAFLESLAQQVGVSIDLRVSDDGSTDSTLIILESYRESFNSLVVTAGPEKGPSENFFSLIAKAKSKYVALADQDDIWEPTHLINSIDRLASSGDVPALSFTRVSEFGEKNQADAGWINGGFFVLENEVMDKIESDSEPFESAVLPRLVQEKQLMAFHHKGFWQPMDTLREKNELAALAKTGTPPWIMGF